MLPAWQRNSGLTPTARLYSLRSFVGILLVSTAPAFAQDDRRIITAAPLAVVPGKETKLLLRGRGLDQLTAVETAQAGVEVALKSKGKAEVPQNYDAEQIGDTQAEVLLKLPAELSPGKLPLVGVTSDGETNAYELLVLPADAVVAEQEPNDSFRKPQPLAIGNTLVGVIHEGKNVDVFRVEGRAGQTLSVEITASSRGSILDPLLTFYTLDGQSLAGIDDRPHADNRARRDPQIDVTLPKDGVCLVVVQDALDNGGVFFSYLLTARPSEQGR